MRSRAALRAPFLALLAAASAAGPVRATEPSTGTVRAEAESDAQRIVREELFRAEVSSRILVFLQQGGFADPDAVRRHDSARQSGGSVAGVVPSYWEVVGIQLVAAVGEYANHAAILYRVLGPSNPSDRNPTHRAQEALMLEHSELVPLRTTQRMQSVAANGRELSRGGGWLTGFLEKGASAGVDVLQRHRADPRGIEARGRGVDVPRVGDQTPLFTGREFARGGSLEELYHMRIRRGGRPVPYFNFEGRKISVRLYTDVDDQGRVVHRIGVVDFTNPSDVHSVFAPADATGASVFTLTDSGGTARDYRIDFTPHGSDVVVRVRRMDAEGHALATHKLWRNREIFADAAVQAASSGAVMMLDGRRYYARHRGGPRGGIELFDADRVDAFMAGRAGAEEILPRHFADTTEPGPYGPRRIGDRAPIHGTSFDLVWDEANELWRPEKTERPPDTLISRSTAAARGGEAGPDAPAGGDSADSAPSQGRGPDADWPETYDTPLGEFMQSRLNSELASRRASYRIYEQGNQGPWTAVRRSGSALEPLRTQRVPDRESGRQVEVPAFMFGSKFQLNDPALALFGNTLILTSAERDIFTPVDDPADERLGEYIHEQGRFFVTREAHIRDVLGFVHRAKANRDGYVAWALDQIAAKKRSLRATRFRQLTGVQAGNGWIYYLQMEDADGLPNAREDGRFEDAEATIPPSDSDRRRAAGSQGGRGEQGGGRGEQGGGRGEQGGGQGPSYQVAPEGRQIRAFGDRMEAPLGQGGSTVTLHRVRTDEAAGYAVFADVDSARYGQMSADDRRTQINTCAVQWRIKDRSGAFSGYYTNVHVVYHRPLAGTGSPSENPCLGGFRIESVQMQDPATLHDGGLASWDGGFTEMTLYNQRNDPRDRIGVLVRRGG